ncbi:unnamed protein product [Didymodactylos carnosus]|uniref:rhomboid protease n=1 Tax=Didymodactylos carnosus TaxID=1234261 RepID=A0A815DXG5_9BILA|nr:unnamed protein product [Didymodactylos carnosus]CAF1302471.1 unnamed protein product [Didymodactylos carnosus]CAF3928359.1 unnamed protein product [Didymodactylos carnosus]CAF4129137.1 unnamed protein product [Didymodactylos carnosus]
MNLLIRSTAVTFLSSNTSSSFHILKRPLSLKSNLFRLLLANVKSFERYSYVLKHRYHQLIGSSNPMKLFVNRKSLNLFSLFNRLSQRRARRLDYTPLNSRSHNSSSKSSFTFPFVNENNLIYIIIGINGLVYALWRFSYLNLYSNRDETIVKFMNKNFTVSWYGVVNEKRIWTLLTSAFSHADLTHFLVNSFVMWSFGPLVIANIGLRNFTQLFFSSAIACSLAHIFYEKYFDKRPRVQAVGASGTTMAMTILYAFLHPFDTVLLFFIIPMPVFVGVGAYICYDLYRAATGRQGTIGSAGHIGGAVAGALFYLLKIRGK